MKMDLFIDLIIILHCIVILLPDSLITHVYIIPYMNIKVILLTTMQTHHYIPVNIGIAVNGK